MTVFGSAAFYFRINAQCPLILRCTDEVHTSCTLPSGLGISLLKKSRVSRLLRIMRVTIFQFLLLTFHKWHQNGHVNSISKQENGDYNCP